MSIRHLNKSAEFTDVIKNGRKISNKTIQVYVKEEKGSPAGLGVIVPKKCVKKAVTRNYIRRLFYSFFRGFGEKTLSGRKIVIRLKTGLDTKEKKPISKTILRELEECSTRGGFYG